MTPVLNLQYPAVNLNGTSRQDLIKQWQGVYNATDALMNALRHANPHGRDYQTLTKGQFNIAMDQHMERCIAAADLHAHATAILEHLAGE